MTTLALRPGSLRDPVSLLIAIAVFATVSGFASPVLAQSPGDSGLPFAPGNPLADLQRQIDELKDGFFPRLYEATVNCNAGEKVRDALRQAPRGALRVVLTIEGTCVENVTIPRDAVTLKGAGADSGIRGSAPLAALKLDGVHRIELTGLTLTDGFDGLHALAGASFSASNLVVRGAAGAGIRVEHNAVGVLHDATMENGGFAGIRTATGGAVSVFGGEIRNNRSFGVFNDGGQVWLAGGVVIFGNENGAHAANGGVLTLQGATVRDSANFGVNLMAASATISGPDTLVTGSGNAAVNLGGGSTVVLDLGARISANFQDGVQLGDGTLNMSRGAVIEDNGGNGLTMWGGSSALITHDSEIRGNRGDGIAITATSVASFSAPSGIRPGITGNLGFGVSCQGPPAVAQYWGEPVFSGNGSATNCPAH